MDATDWSKQLAILIADSLVEQGLIRSDDFNRVVAVVAEEINVRLALNDYPPPQP